MVVRMERRPRSPRSSRRGIIIAVVLAVIIAVAASARFYTDVLWFREVGFSTVLWTSLRTQFFLGALVGVVVGVVIWANLFVAGRLAPSYRLSGLTGREDPLDRYRDAVAPYLTWIRVGIAAVLGLMTGIGAGGAWRTYLLWANRVDFGVNDPQFGKDVGFYVFELPFFDVILSWIWFALFASLFVSAAAHYFQGSLRPEAGLSGILPGALAHISVLLGLLALTKAGQYYLGTYQLNFSPRGVVHGASYTDVHAQLPALRLLAIISIISAVLFLVNIRVRRFALPLAAVGIWILTAFLAGFVWPQLVQRFSVEPQEQQREAEFIARNIEATRAAYGLDGVASEPFAASAALTGEDIVANEPLLRNVRLWDPTVLAQAYEQLQTIRTYYHFKDVDIDRYEIDGDTRQVLLSARELSTEDLSEESKKWTNLHLQYTHGYGLVASLANESTSSGQPRFLVKDLPGTAVAGAESLLAEQAGIYFGEIYPASEYSVVNSKQDEIDFETEEGTQRSNYQGAGGIELGNIFQRIAFALREGDPNLVLSNLITGDSRILIYKNVRDRVSRAAPFLALDNDPYIVAMEDRLVWVLDAYTTTNFYPYSQRRDTDESIATDEQGALDKRINYIRNSVKVAVDAYDGTMKFYIVDETDPMIQAWRNAFPDLFTTEEPPDELRAHFRYPEDLFKIQSDVYLRYHMTDPADFYSNTDEWSVPADPQGNESVVPPTYLLAALPGELEDEFILTRQFTPRKRPNMIAFFIARSDPEHYGELITLHFPSTRLVPGPVQVDNLINQDVEISQTLTLLGQQGSTVSFGRLITLPIEDSILYVQPLFVTAENVGIPELKKVVVSFGEEVVMADTFEEALVQLFDITEPEPTPTPTPTPTDGGPKPDGGGGGADDLQSVIEQAARVYDQAQAALAASDFEEYGRLIEKLGRLLERAEQLTQ